MKKMKMLTRNSTTKNVPKTHQSNKTLIIVDMKLKIQTVPSDWTPSPFNTHALPQRVESRGQKLDLVHFSF